MATTPLLSKLFFGGRSVRTKSKPLPLILLIGFMALFPIAQGQGQGPAPVPPGTFRVTLIGTGYTPMDPNRMGPSILVEAGDRKLLFDAGRGTGPNLTKYGVQVGEITDIYLTHLHADHILDIPDLWISGYLRSNGHRKGPLKITGPSGVDDHVSGLRATYSDIFQLWGIVDADRSITSTELIGEGTVLDEGNLQVVSFKVDHGKLPAFGYKVTFGGRSVVISGDTAYSENLVEKAKNTDLLVHSVIADDQEALMDEGLIEQLRAILATPEDVFRVMALARPRTTVLYHLRSDGDTLPKKIEDAPAGTVYIGEDLMTFTIGKSTTVSIGS